MTRDDDLPPLWDRQPGESEQAYYAFQLYRDQETPRGYSRVVSELGKSKTLIHRWGSRWFWRDRTRAWDRHLEDELRREQIRETRAMGRRQARDMQAIGVLLMQPVELALRRLNDATRRAELEKLPLGDLIALSILAGRVLPRVLRAERDARGAPVQDLTQFLDDETGEVLDAPSPREVYDWTREAIAALEQATGGRLALPPGGETNGA